MNEVIKIKLNEKIIEMKTHNDRFEELRRSL